MYAGTLITYFCAEYHKTCYIHRAIMLVVKVQQSTVKIIKISGSLKVKQFMIMIHDNENSIHRTQCTILIYKRIFKI